MCRQVRNFNEFILRPLQPLINNDDDGFVNSSISRYAVLGISIQLSVQLAVVVWRTRRVYCVSYFVFAHPSSMTLTKSNILFLSSNPIQQRSNSSNKQAICVAQSPTLPSLPFLAPYLSTTLWPRSVNCQPHAPLAMVRLVPNVLETMLVVMVQTLPRLVAVVVLG